MVAQCANCGAVFELELTEVSDESLPNLNQDPLDPTPSGVTVDVDDGTLVLTYRWFGCAHLLLIPFTLFWNGFMVTWYGIALTEGEPTMALFGLPHLCVGIGLAYYTISGCINKTIVRLDPLELTVEHTPLPWRGAGSLPLADLDQLYVSQKVHKGKNGVSYSYELIARKKNGSNRHILRGMTSHQAKFMERRLELTAGIEDQRVAGEHLG